MASVSLQSRLTLNCKLSRWAQDIGALAVDKDDVLCPRLHENGGFAIFALQSSSGLSGVPQPDTDSELQE